MTAPEASESSAPRARVLVVDDDHTVGRLFEAALAQTCNVAVCTHVAEATTKLFAEKFDLVITDWRLKDGTGASLLAVVASVQPETPTIVITGYPDVDEVRSLQREGRVLVLTKPFEIAQLRAWVLHSLNVARLEAAARKRTTRRSSQRPA